eukprot:6377500-Amphidinium_carterae.3
MVGFERVNSQPSGAGEHHQCQPLLWLRVPWEQRPLGDAAARLLPALPSLCITGRASRSLRCIAGTGKTESTKDLAKARAVAEPATTALGVLEYVRTNLCWDAEFVGFFPAKKPVLEQSS